MSLFDDIKALFEAVPPAQDLAAEIVLLEAKIKQQAADREKQFQYTPTSRKLADGLLEHLKTEGIDAVLREDGLIVYEWTFEALK